MMEPFTLGANMAMSGANGLIGIGSTMLQNHYNKQLAEYQNDFNLEMWHRQNEYNSPKETMNRLVEAGINPRAYQQIGQFANAGAPQPAAQMSKTSELSAFQSVVRQGLENQLLSERLKQTRADTKLKQILTGTGLNEQELQRLKYILTSLEHGLDPVKIGGPMVTHYEQYDDSGRSRPAYMSSDLYKYITTGSTKHPYLRKQLLGNLLQEAGIDLRKFEADFKKFELDDYENHGIRGNSDYINLFRFIKSLFK